MNDCSRTTSLSENRDGESPDCFGDYYCPIPERGFKYARRRPSVVTSSQRLGGTLA